MGGGGGIHTIRLAVCGIGLVIIVWMNMKKEEKQLEL